MNDAAKNVEIEDVLASIRRLVSEEAHREVDQRSAVGESEPSSRGAKHHAQDLNSGDATETAESRGDSGDILEAQASEPDALVLTPAQRVSDVAHPDETNKSGPIDLGAFIAPAPPALAEDDALSSPTLASSEPSGSNDTLALLDALVAKPDEPSSLADTQDVGGMKRALEEDFQRVIAPKPGGAHHAEPLDDPMIGGSLSVAAPTATDTLEDKIARLERLVSESTDEFEPDSELDPVALDWQREPREKKISPAAPASMDSVGTSRPSEGQAFKPTQAHGFAERGQEPFVSGATSPKALSETGAANATNARSDLLLDEDMLRDMVAVMVRDELRGALGEKITRNVRNLVRREVNRALASRDLE